MIVMDGRADASVMWGPLWLGDGLAGWIGGNRGYFERTTDFYRPARPAGAAPPPATVPETGTTFWIVGWIGCAPVKAMIQ
jgi:hypothetical protein